MKRSIVIIAILFFNNAFSQSTNDKLIDVYGEESTNKLLKKNPNKQVYFDIVLNNSFEILENHSCEECIDVIGLDEIEKIKIENPTSNLTKEINLEYFLSPQFNILRFAVKRDMKDFVYYRIGNSGYSLKLVSTWKITQLYNSKIKKSN